MFMCHACCMQKHNTGDNNLPSKISWHILRTEMQDNIFTRITLETHSVDVIRVWMKLKDMVLHSTLWMWTQNINPAALFTNPRINTDLQSLNFTLRNKTWWEISAIPSHYNVISSKFYLTVFLLRDKTHTEQIHNDNISPFKNLLHQHYRTQCSIYSRTTYLLYIILETHFDVIHVRMLRYYDTCGVVWHTGKVLAYSAVGPRFKHQQVQEIL